MLLKLPALNERISALARGVRIIVLHVVFLFFINTYNLNYSQGVELSMNGSLRLREVFV